MKNNERQQITSVIEILIAVIKILIASFLLA